MIEPRVSGEVVLTILGGIIGGNIIRSMDLEFDLERIEVIRRKILRHKWCDCRVNFYLHLFVLILIYINIL